MDDKLYICFISAILDNYGIKFDSLSKEMQSKLIFMVACNTTKDINEFILLNLR